MFLDKILNIGTDQNVSLAKAVLMMYLVVASNYSINLLSGQTMEFLRQSRLAQLIIGFVMMLVIIKSTTNISTNNAVLYGFTAYLWFLLSTKLDLQINLAIVALLIGGYFYESMMDDQDKLMAQDDNITQIEKDKAGQKHRQMRTFIGLSILGLTAFGVWSYLGKKQCQYGECFSVDDFLFGPSGRVTYYLTTQ